MRESFELIPHRSFGPVVFGDSRAEVKEKLSLIPKTMRSAGNRDVVDQLVVHYDKSDRVIYVESEKSSLYDITYAGTDVFAIGVLDLLRQLLGTHGYVETEVRRTFVAPHIDVVVGVDAKGVSLAGANAKQKRIEIIGAGSKGYFKKFIISLGLKEMLLTR